MHRAWLLLCGVGAFLLLLSVVVADQLARSLVRPLTALALASDRLAAATCRPGPRSPARREVRRASTGLNRLAARIGDLLAHERETVADLSHRLRTPLTALRIDAESLRDDAERAQLLTTLTAMERTVSEIIREARRPAGATARGRVRRAAVIGERAAFWQPLAEDQERPMTVDLAPGPVMVRASAEDLAACTDILLENVFSHTPDGRPSASAHPAGGRRRLAGGRRRRAGLRGLVIPTRRGLSSGGSTGLGLDIARRVAENSGGGLTVGHSASGGASVTIELGPPVRPPGRAPPPPGGRAPAGAEQDQGPGFGHEAEPPWGLLERPSAGQHPRR